MPWNRLRWNLYAPFYNLGIGWFTARPRRESLASLGLKPGQKLLVIACGTGLDFANVPKGVGLHALDFSPAMVARARQAAVRAGFEPAQVVQGDATTLPYPDGRFDAVALHLILAVADHPERILAEALRVLKPGGQAVVFDKGVPEGRKPGTLRQILNLAARPLATDITLDLAGLVRRAGFRLLDTRPLLGGLFFRIRADRPAPPVEPNRPISV